MASTSCPSIMSKVCGINKKRSTISETGSLIIPIRSCLSPGSSSYTSTCTKASLETPAKPRCTSQLGCSVRARVSVRTEHFVPLGSRTVTLTKGSEVPVSSLASSPAAPSTCTCSAPLATPPALAPCAATRGPPERSCALSEAFSLSSADTRCSSDSTRGSSRLGSGPGVATAENRPAAAAAGCTGGTTAYGCVWAAAAGSEMAAWGCSAPAGSWAGGDCA
mmetsp:Transcript_27391/g.69179  ORF Transcript_27391/g.69179 Transcript_27391/m.69179 type:complete len:221 (+) Transcript_27391:304-966(+)